MSKNLIDLDRVIEYQKKASNFVNDLNFIATGINTYCLKLAINESLSDEEMLLLKTKTTKLINDLGFILA